MQFCTDQLLQQSQRACSGLYDPGISVMTFAFNQEPKKEEIEAPQCACAPCFRHIALDENRWKDHAGRRFHGDLGLNSTEAISCSHDNDSQ